DRHGNLNDLITSVIIDKVNVNKEFKTIGEVEGGSFSKTKELAIIIKNIKKIDPKDTESYIKDKALPLFKTTENDNLKTELRKLFLAYDLLTNGDVNKLA
ncbi:hypothetical protein ACUNEV_12315, partial [Serratia sp. IR-2025]